MPLGMFSSGIFYGGNELYITFFEYNAASTSFQSGIENIVSQLFQMALSNDRKRTRCVKCNGTPV
jgi:hypothetical protein